MAKKQSLVCKPCGSVVLVTDQGDAVIECYECGVEMVPAAAKKAVKALPKKAAVKKPAAKKAAPKKKK